MPNLDRISKAEVMSQSVDLLPSREALALVNITNITAVNIARSVNAGTIGSPPRLLELGRTSRSSSAHAGGRRAAGAAVRGTDGGQRAGEQSTTWSTARLRRVCAAGRDRVVRPGADSWLVRGSGFRDERDLVERADRQVVMLTKLLYLIVRFADGRTSTDLLATRVSKAYGHRLDPDDLVQLIEDKLLRRVGRTAGGPGAGVGRADPLLALSIRGCCPGASSGSSAGCSRRCSIG